MNFVKRWQTPEFLLLGIGSSLIAFHLTLISKATGNFNQMMLSGFFWCAILSGLWHKRQTLNLTSNLGSTISGLFLILWMLIRSLLSHNYDDVLSFFSPFISAFGLALLASGFSGCKQYWRELSIVWILAFPLAILLGYVDRGLAITTIDAKLATFFLWYIGFEVTREGVQVILPTGAIEIYLGCSSLQAVISLAQLSLLVSLLFPLRVYQILVMLGGGVLIALSVNAVRLGLMAFLVANSDQSAFQYWHGSQGGQIFSTLSFVLFGALVYCLLEFFPVDSEKVPGQDSSTQS